MQNVRQSLLEAAEKRIYIQRLQALDQTQVASPVRFRVLAMCTLCRGKYVHSIVIFNSNLHPPSTVPFYLVLDCLFDGIIHPYTLLAFERTL